MKNVWFAAGLLALIVAFCLTVNHIVSVQINELLAHLDRAEWLADHRDFEGAREEVRSAATLWERRKPLFSMALPAHRSNEASAALRGLYEQLACEDYEAYKASGALLAAALESLAEGYRITWENLM